MSMPFTRLDSCLVIFNFPSSLKCASTPVKTEHQCNIKEFDSAKSARAQAEKGLIE
jgi:hypothetical protein